MKKLKHIAACCALISTVSLFSAEVTGNIEKIETGLPAELRIFLDSSNDDACATHGYEVRSVVWSLTLSMALAASIAKKSVTIVYDENDENCIISNFIYSP